MSSSKSSSSVSSVKRKCTFNNDLAEEFPYIKIFRGNLLHCQKCNGQFSIASGGRTAIIRHLETDKHKKTQEAAASSSTINKFFRSVAFGDKEKQLAISEATFAFHTIYHNQSFRSMDCTSKLIQNMFEHKFTCARTKTEAIIKKVLAPYALNQLRNELQLISFLSVYSDASNHKDQKLFPTLIRYFHPLTGINIKILDFVSLPGETAEVICNSLVKILKENEIENKVVAFCADNANTNFGGVARKGSNNVFAKICTELKRKLIGVGCAAHILHNAMQTAADLLPIDVDSIIVKIYSHFYIYTVRVESLKQFCEESDVQYKQLLGYSKTRWLALLPAIERILKMFAPLRSYFLSIEKCPKLLETFFNSDSSELWLKFVHSQASIFHNAVKQIEGEHTSVFEISEQILSVKQKFEARIEENYLPLLLRSDLTKLVEQGSLTKEWFLSHVNNFYASCVQYLDKWTVHFKDVDNFQWLSLRQPVSWDMVEKCLIYVNDCYPKHGILDNGLFDEFTSVKSFTKPEKIDHWNNSEILVQERWLEMFQHFQKNHIVFTNTSKLVQFGLCLPGTNAPTERVFSMVNKLWTTEKTQLSVDTVKAMIMVKCNLSSTCGEFSQLISDNTDILKQVHSAEKYL